MTLGLFPDDKTQPPAKPLGSGITARIYCDGACSGNPGPGGWGCIVEMDGARHELSGSDPQTTNNQMELRALIEGLKALPSSANVEIVTDSEYITKGINSWLGTWVQNGWRTASRQPVKNQNLWQDVLFLLEPRRFRTEWVRGHAGHPENERCDELARTAIRQLRKNSTASGRT